MGSGLISFPEELDASLGKLIRMLECCNTQEIQTVQCKFDNEIFVTCTYLNSIMSMILQIR